MFALSKGSGRIWVGAFEAAREVRRSFQNVTVVYDRVSSDGAEGASSSKKGRSSNADTQVARIGRRRRRLVVSLERKKGRKGTMTGK